MDAGVGDAGSMGEASIADAAADRELVDSGAVTCVVRPAQTDGPYFVDERLDRSDIRIDPSDGSTKDGVELRLTIGVYRAVAMGCAPVVGALIDIWQCDALGVYSDVKDTNGLFDTVGKKFLRGYQLTDDMGVVKFVTIYPGWYQGRTVHIHFKVRTNPASAQGMQFTSQLYFDDALTDTVLTAAPYSTKGPRTTRNAMDGIFQMGGAQLMLSPTKIGGAYEARFDLGLRV
jgi:protocatechuate 3,4-dioxygenase beta subunit